MPVLKEPTPGHVKTRLAASIGTEAAGTVYRACVELTLQRLAHLREESVLCVDPPEALARARDWLGPGWTLQAQRGSDLGARLTDATGRAFADGAQRVVVLGTDSPWVRERDIVAAFAALRRSDVVLGPTTDGGYYLIGLSRPVPEIFEGIAWSSPSVFAQTQSHAHTLGLRLATLRPGYDLDQLDDVRRFVQDERQRGAVPAAVETIEAASQGRVG